MLWFWWSTAWTRDWMWDALMLISTISSLMLFRTTVLGLWSVLQHILKCQILETFQLYQALGQQTRTTLWWNFSGYSPSSWKRKHVRKLQMCFTRSGTNTVASNDSSDWRLRMTWCQNLVYLAHVDQCAHHATVLGSTICLYVVGTVR